MSHSYVTCPIHMLHALNDMWHDSLICVPWLIETWHDSLISDPFDKGRKFGIPRIPFGHDAGKPSFEYSQRTCMDYSSTFICVIWLILMWHDSFICSFPRVTYEQVTSVISLYEEPYKSSHVMTRIKKSHICMNESSHTCECVTSVISLYEGPYKSSHVMTHI